MEIQRTQNSNEVELKYIRAIIGEAWKPLAFVLFCFVLFCFVFTKENIKLRQ